MLNARLCDFAAAAGGCSPTRAAAKSHGDGHAAASRRDRPGPRSRPRPPALSDRGANRSDASPMSPESWRIAITPLDSLWVSPRDASSSSATRRRPALPRSGRLRCLRRQDPFRCGRSNRALCQTDRLPSRSRACASLSALRVSCAEASPSPRSARRCSRRDPVEVIRRPAPASSRLAERMSAGAQSRSLPPMKEQGPNVHVMTSAPARVPPASRHCRRHFPVPRSRRSRSPSPLRGSVSANRTARHRHRASRRALRLSP
jgi:hypothetical protein